MSALTPEKLYQLLPAVHRIRDELEGGPLRSLLSLAGEQGGVVEQDIAQLFDNWFIETCQEWVVPYIADLLGLRGLNTLPTGIGVTQRARVANTLGYRRRRGTATMLEQLARDTTGWPARAVEFFQILGWNQNYNHVRPNASRTPDLRRTNELELLNTAFDTAMHTVDIRRIAIDRGRHNIPNIGLFLWRLQEYHVRGSIARPTAQAGFYTFNPVANQKRPLFNIAQTEVTITHLAEEFNVPGQLRRRPLYDELENRRATILQGGIPRGVWFNTAAPVLQIFEQTNAIPPFAYTKVPPEKIRICHLGPGAPRPDPADADGNPIVVGVDPVLGLLAWADTLPLPAGLKISYAYGFSGDLGGGSYDRGDSVEEFVQQKVTPKLRIDWHVGVTREQVPAATGTIFTSLVDAVVEWNAQPKGKFGIISIMDSQTYVGNVSIDIKEGSKLLIVAADWPAVPDDSGGKKRITGDIDPVDVRPHIVGNVTINGTALASSDSPGSVAIDGLLIEGSVVVSAGQLSALRIAHSTIVPGIGDLSVDDKNEHLTIELRRTICGPIELPATGPTLNATDCIVDAGKTTAIDATNSELNIESCTIFGETDARIISASNSIFTGIVTAARRQEGCVRYSFLPDGSATGRRYRCQPELALATAEAAAKEAGKNFDPAAADAVLARVTPVLTDETWGHPAYAQLAATCPVELKTGSEDASEMGAFNFLKQPQREANLRASLDEYLRFGLEAGLIFAT